MEELTQIKEAVTVHQTILVIDAMTGQDAVNVAKEFNEKAGLTASSSPSWTATAGRGGPVGQSRDRQAYPLRRHGERNSLTWSSSSGPDASRILGMGDVLTLIEKAEAEIDEEKAKEMSKKLKKAQFDFEDYLESMQQMKKMGGLGSIMSMMPGFGGMGPMGGMGKKGISEEQTAQAERSMARMEAMIYSMTTEERRNPDLLNPSRKHRIARGAGVDISEVNRMVKQFAEMKKMMKMLGKGGKRRKFGMPF